MENVEVTVNLSFYRRNFSQIPNDTQYAFRRAVARCLTRYGFGNIREQDQHFWNERIAPVVDDYNEGEATLVQVYIFQPRLLTGDINGFLIGGIPQLINWVRGYHAHETLIVRVMYSEDE